MNLQKSVLAVHYFVCSLAISCYRKSCFEETSHSLEQTAAQWSYGFCLSLSPAYTDTVKSERIKSPLSLKWLLIKRGRPKLACLSLVLLSLTLYPFN